MASAVCRGFRQVQTFIRSVFSTVSREAKRTPPFSSGGRPAGKASSITRYSQASALTKGAATEPVTLERMVRSSTPSSASIRRMASSGRGVILSIMVQGKETQEGSPSQPENPSETSPLFSQASAMARTACFSTSPLWEQLSMLTMARGWRPFR